MSDMLTRAHRQFNLDNAVMLQSVDNTIRRIRRRQSDDKNDFRNLLDKVSSSGSSMLAHSRSTEVRLSNLSAEVQSMKDLLVEALSAHSSTSDALAGDSQKRECTVISTDRSGSRKKSTMSDILGKEIQSTHFEQPTVTSTVLINDNPPEPEFEALFNATECLANAVQKLFHPLMAEYISTANAWRIGQAELACLAMEPSIRGWGGAADEKAILAAVGRQSRSAGRLLSIRKMCLREGLDESLKGVDNEVGIDDEIINDWMTSIPQHNSSRGVLPLEKLGLPDHTELKKDRLTFTNEWMLGVVQSYPRLMGAP
jgi:hypothetical protein